MTHLQCDPFGSDVQVHLTVTGQNGTGQNGMDKMVVIFGIDYNSSEFNSYLVTKIHNEMINTQRKPKRLKVEAGLMKKSYCQWEWN